MLIRNLSMPKTKWDGAEEPTINNVYTIDSRTFSIWSGHNMGYVLRVSIIDCPLKHLNILLLYIYKCVGAG